MNKILFFILSLFFGCIARTETDAPSLDGEKPIEASQETALPAQGKGIIQEGLSEPDLLRQNPFLTLKEEESFRGKDFQGVIIDYLNLSAVFYAPYNSKAIIEGRIFKKGDILDNKEIIEIGPEEVILKDSQTSYILKMRQVLGAKQDD